MELVDALLIVITFASILQLVLLYMISQKESSSGIEKEVIIKHMDKVENKYNRKPRVFRHDEQKLYERERERRGE